MQIGHVATLAAVSVTGMLALGTAGTALRAIPNPKAPGFPKQNEIFQWGELATGAAGIGYLALGGTHLSGTSRALLGGGAIAALGGPILTYLSVIFGVPPWRVPAEGFRVGFLGGAPRQTIPTPPPF